MNSSNTQIILNIIFKLFLRNEILKLRKPSGQSNDPRPIQIGVCMNCIVMQQALSMANAALKSNFDFIN